MKSSSPDGPRPRVAIAHDYLTQRGGAERVVLAMHRAFPEASISTTLFDPAGTFPEFGDVDLQLSALNRIPVLRRHHRLALPLLPSAMNRLQADADVVLCSSSGWAHGVATTGRKVVYCHTPARWLYVDGQAATVGGVARLASSAVRTLGPPLRRWDRRAASSATRYLANSSLVAQRIREVYDLEAEVIFPPISADLTGPRQAPAGIESGYLLCVARLMPYKNVEAVAAAVAGLSGERLVIVGDGPAASLVRQAAIPAGSRVILLPRVEDDELRWLYANAKALVSAAPDDFGLTPVEAAAFGVPTIGIRAAGLLETIVEDETGVFIEGATPAEISDGIRRAGSMAWSRDRILVHAEQFSEERFARRLHEIIAEELADLVPSSAEAIPHP